MSDSTPGLRFDSAYFGRYYGARATRVQGAREVARLARVIIQMVEWIGGPVDSVLDVGAGTGLWRDWFQKHRPAVRYVSTDVSPYACSAYGHTRLDIAHRRPRRKFDFVICQGVLPYLSDTDAVAAIENLAGATRGFMYLEAVTRRDMRRACDTERTDPTQTLRTGAWYRRHLRRHFVMLGMGLYASRSLDLPLFELECTR